VKHTGAKILLVQEGIRLAEGNGAQRREVDRRELVMIHPHSERSYRKHPAGSLFALKKMSELGKAKAVLVAHDLQLQRPIGTSSRRRKRGRSGGTSKSSSRMFPRRPFPAIPLNAHRGGFRYKFIELFWSARATIWLR